MRSLDKMLKYKTAILSAVLGALISGVISLSAGLFSLTKSFGMAQNKERITNLRYEIDTLRKVERELDYNLALLMKQELQVFIEVEKAVYNIPDDIKDEAIRTFMAAYFKEFFRNTYNIKSVKIPKDRFRAGVWPYRGLPPGEVDFELGQKLQDLYMILSRVNRCISDIDYISQSSLSYMGYAEVERMRRLRESITQDVSYLSKENIILVLKNDVVSEISRLRGILDKIRK